MSSALLQPEAAPILACTISRDVQNFDLLIEDMETAMGESWGDLGFADAMAFFNQPDSEALEFVAVAIDAEDEADLPLISEVLSAAKARNIKVILIAEDVSSIALHQLLRQGADEFVPYPLPENELNEAIERLQTPEEEPIPAEMQTKLKATGDKDGVVLPVHGLAGGTGATTMAVNLAWELANTPSEKPIRVCLLDLDLQFGTASTFLDLPRREAIYELISDTESMDSESFMNALLTYNEKLHVLTAPQDMLPLDLIGPEDVERLITVAQTNFDYVVIDMPSTLVSWTEVALQHAHIYFSPLELDMRCAQNALRMVKALKAEDLPFEKLRFVMNRAPKITDLSGRSRVKRLAESLNVAIEVLLPDGGKQVTQGSDHGVPLSETAAKNPLRKELAKLAASIHELNVAAEAAA
ncbi:MAG: AAA family ATPase [Pseudomonadota bacterium]